MKNNILKAFSNNLGFKILAVLFAFTLWLTVYNIEDPTKSKTLTINVTVANKEYIDSLGKYFEIKDGTNKVSFSVTAARSVLDKLDESDFTAVANMEQIIVEDNGVEARVPIEITCTANVNSNSVRLSSTNKSLKVTLDELMTKQFVVSASAIGEVAEGYALGNVTVTAPNVLKIAGPKSIVEEIASVIATIDVSGMSESWATYRATPILFNEEGKEIDTTRLTFSDETVNVSAEILNIKEVPVTAKPTGKPAKGYEVTGIYSNPATIKLKGSKALLNSINEIVIPEGVISVNGASSNVVTTIDVTEYIPANTALANGENPSVEVTIVVGKTKEKTFDVKTSSITVTGLPTGGKIRFALESVAVTVSGLESDVNALSSLKGSIDVTGLSAGTHNVPLVLELDEIKYTYSNVKLKVTIEDSVSAETKPESKPENSTGNNTGTGTETKPEDNAGNNTGTETKPENSTENSTENSGDGSKPGNTEGSTENTTTPGNMESSTQN